MINGNILFMDKTPPNRETTTKKNKEMKDPLERALIRGGPSTMRTGETKRDTIEKGRWRERDSSKECYG